jgi:mannan endo-1,4-beta-mannosidase
MNRTKALLLALIIAGFALTFVSHAQESGDQARAANPNINAVAQNILNYLERLPSSSANRIISGQFGSYGSGTSYNTAQQQLQRVFDQTGLWPGLTGMDCAMPGGMNEVIRYMTDKWNEGYLVTLSCHARNPWTGGESTDIANRRNVRELITPGAPGNAAWVAHLDQLAAALQTLEDRGVVVFLRPLHEMNGSWFWWGEQEPADFIALWRHMFDYFTRIKELNNLLWVYSPSSGVQKVDTLYPGNDVLDVVSLDEYSELDESVMQINQHAEYTFLIGTGKPFGLFEFGPIPASGAGWNTSNYRWTNLIRDVKALYPRTVLFQASEYVWQLGRDQYRNLPQLMNDPWVITRDELPDWRDSQATMATTPVSP